MKKNILILILCLFIVGLFINVSNISTVGADSGFDSSYGSGGSWDSGSDWDSSSSGVVGNSDPATILMIPYIFWGILGLFVCLSKFKKKEKHKFKADLFLISYILSMILILLLEFYLIDDKSEAIHYVILQNILAITIIFLFLKGFKTKFKQITVQGIDNNKIVIDAFNIYKDLQTAWMHFDYDKIKKLVSDEMYNMYTNQLETLKIKNQKNIMSEIEFIEGYITDYKMVNNKEIFKVYLSVSCYDYIINTKNNMTVRGNKNRKLTLSYILTFEKNIDIINYCPQCGADVKNLTECNYCKSKIVNNNDKLKMTKKQIVSQK